MSAKGLVRALLTALVVLVMPAAPALAQTTEATITVVHAIPGEDGFPADVYIDGQKTVLHMVFDAVSEPVAVPAGPLDVALFASGTDPSATEPLLAQQLTLEAGSSYTLVVQMIDGSPAMALYLNDLAPVDAGVTRVTVRHTGTSGPLQVTVAGENVVTDLMSPNEVTVEVPAGLQPLSVATADGSSLLEQDIDFRAGSLVVLYTVGEPGGQEQFGLLTQQVTIPQVSPTGVPTGTGGLRAEGLNAVWLVLPMAFVVGAVLAIRPRRSAER